MVLVMRNRTSEIVAKTGRNGGEKVVKNVNHRFTQMNSDFLEQRLSTEGWLPVLSDLLLIRIDLCPSAVQWSFGIGQIVRNQEDQVVTC